MDEEGQRSRLDTKDKRGRPNHQRAGTSLCGSVEGVGSCTSPAVGCGNAINYGIKTGYNDAFIIDNQTKDALIAEDPRSAEIIKPVLRGRDIQRYQAQWKGLWLIATFPALGSQH